MSWIDGNKMNRRGWSVPTSDVEGAPADARTAGTGEMASGDGGRIGVAAVPHGDAWWIEREARALRAAFYRRTLASALRMIRGRLAEATTFTPSAHTPSNP